MAVTVTIGGQELRLARPKGRAGRLFVARVQKLLKTVAPMALEYADVDGTDIGVDDLGALLDVSSDLFFDDDLKLEDEILPGLFIWSDAGLTKEEALARLDEIEDTPMEISNAIMAAAVYWIRPDEDDEEALAEAQKKSPPAEKAGPKKEVKES